jgi:hypothetical protein
MGRFVDSVIAYRILKMLVTPFEETDAYSLGIIDAKGKELKKMSQLNTVQERDSYSILHRMIFRIKRIIEKVPVESKKIATFAAALALIKENYNSTQEPIDLETQFLNRININHVDEIMICEQFFSKNNTKTFKQFLEDAPANNAAATPGIAGFTPETLGVKKKPKLIRRKRLDNVSIPFKPI